MVLYTVYNCTLSITSFPVITCIPKKKKYNAYLLHNWPEDTVFDYSTVLCASTVYLIWLCFCAEQDRRSGIITITRQLCTKQRRHWIVVICVCYTQYHTTGHTINFWRQASNVNGTTTVGGSVAVGAIITLWCSGITWCK